MATAWRQMLTCKKCESEQHQLCLHAVHYPPWCAVAKLSHVLCLCVLQPGLPDDLENCEGSCLCTCTSEHCPFRACLTQTLHMSDTVPCLQAALRIPFGGAKGEWVPGQACKPDHTDALSCCQHNCCLSGTPSMPPKHICQGWPDLQVASDAIPPS